MGDKERILSLIVDAPDIKTWIEDALKMRIPKEDIISAIKEGLKKKASFWDSQAKDHAKKYADEAKFRLLVIENKGLKEYLKIIPGKEA